MSAWAPRGRCDTSASGGMTDRFPPSCVMAGPISGMNRYEQICAQFYDNRLLFGNPADGGVVAVEIASRNQVEVIRRLNGELRRERRPLRLFALVADRELMRG